MEKVFGRATIIITAVAALMITGCDKDNDDIYITPPPVTDAIVLSAGGDSASILTKLNEFRLLSGETVNGAPGATSGRREVNWDGVPSTLTNNNNFPFDFFGSSDPAVANGRKRGLILKNTGTTFRVDTTDFSEIEPTYASQFEAFTRKRLFAYMGNNITEVTFNVPGTTTPAFVKGFAVIFSDVDQAVATTIEYFEGTKSLGSFNPKPASQGFSFLGVGFPSNKVTRVKITSGNALLAAGIKDISNGGNKDLVVMDDFIYDEPKAIN